MTTILTAAQARDLMEENKPFSQIERILHRIEYYARKKINSMYVDEPLYKETVETLKKLGYTVKLFNRHYEGVEARIIWDSKSHV